MEMNLDETLARLRQGEERDCARKLLDLLANHPDDPETHFLAALVAEWLSHDSAISFPDSLFHGWTGDQQRAADDYEKIGLGLRSAGFEKLAQFAFKTAAARDKSDAQRPHPWGDVPFNGQKKRLALFKELLKHVDLEAIVETGTFRASTTLFLHEASGLDVYSCELNDRYFEFASERVAGRTGIYLFREDSREFLLKLGHDERLRGKKIFFYLDAHWNADLPLAQELQIIFQHFDSPLIMIDDFEVPGRPEFEFDDYGENAILSLDVLESIISPHTSLYYPNWPLESGSGPKRGFVIVANERTRASLDALGDLLFRVDGFRAALLQLKQYRKSLQSTRAALAEQVTLHDLKADELAAFRAKRDADIASRDDEIAFLRSSLEKSARALSALAAKERLDRSTFTAILSRLRFKRPND